MREFMYEFHPKTPLRQSEIFKIWGGCILSSPHDMVKDRTRGKVDQAYLEWVHDQPFPKVMPEGSIKGPIDREAEIEVKIKQARLKVEKSYKSVTTRLVVSSSRITVIKTDCDDGSHDGPS